MTREESKEIVQLILDEYIECRDIVGAERIQALQMAVKVLRQTFTDSEERIFLAAMGRETNICRKLDDEDTNSEKRFLLNICDSIVRKVKETLWEEL